VDHKQGKRARKGEIMAMQNSVQKTFVQNTIREDGGSYELAYALAKRARVIAETLCIQASLCGAREAVLEVVQEMTASRPDAPSASRLSSDSRERLLETVEDADRVLDMTRRIEESLGESLEEARPLDHTTVQAAIALAFVVYTATERLAVYFAGLAEEVAEAEALQADALQAESQQPDAGHDAFEVTPRRADDPISIVEGLITKVLTATTGGTETCGTETCGTEIGGWLEAMATNAHRISGISGAIPAMFFPDYCPQSSASGVEEEK
jgi:hypothetical protein